MNEKLFFHIHIAQLEEPKSGECLIDHWWVVHPVRGALFYELPDGSASPQCNSDKTVAGLVREKVYPEHDLVQIATAYFGNGIRRPKNNEEAAV